MHVVVLGASGMLGHVMLRLLGEREGWRVTGKIRWATARAFFPAGAALVAGVDAEIPDKLARVIAETRPDVVVNCIGIVKQAAAAGHPLEAIPVNALLPHRLARLSELLWARLIHISTDCVFSGRRGNYCEADLPDPIDLYGARNCLARWRPRMP